MQRLFIVIALLAACGDDDGGTSGPLTIDGLGDALARASCDQYVRCGLLEDASLCAGFYSDASIDPSVVAAVDAGKIIFHADQARACIDGLTGSCLRDLFFRGGGSEACDAMFEGTIAAGGSCALNEECTSLNCNIPSCPDACCLGTCVGDAPVPWVHVGESCAASPNSCIDSFCDATTQLCTAYHAAGEACASASQCAPGTSCTNAVCTAQPGPGEPCTRGSSDSACRDVGYTCSLTTSTCVEYGLDGDACTDSRDCSPIFHSCGTAGTCELDPKRGEPCDAGRDCIDNSYCDATTMLCTARKPDGATCAASSECESGECDSVTLTCATPATCI